MKKNDLLKAVKQAILQQAIQGKLTADWREQNPNTEPASELLKRIKAEKEKLIKEKKIRKEKPLPPITQDQIPFELPEGWVWCRLGEIISMNYGKSLTKSQTKQKGDYPVYGSNGIVGYYNKGLTDRKSIIIGRKGSAGAIQISYTGSWTTDVAYYIEENNILYFEYLIFLLKSLNLDKLGKGIKPGLNRNEAYLLLVPLPPLAEQKAIVEKVEALMQQLEMVDRGESIDNMPVIHQQARKLIKLYDKINITINEIQIQKQLVKQLKQSILQEAIQGKLTADWRSKNYPQKTPPLQGEVARSDRGVNIPLQGEVAESRRGLNNLPHLKTFRKQLRKNLTPAEAKLWTYLKGKQLEGRKFRRQFSVGNYILDFYCPSEKLAIELDGQGHFELAQAEYDFERDLFLRHTGINVLRFENKWVWEDLEGLLEEIKRNFGWNKNPSNSSVPQSGSAPLKGEQLLDEYWDARVLLEKIKAEKEKLIKEKKIRKEKPLPPITQDEIPFELPKGWVWSILDEISLFKNGKAHEQFVDSNGKYILINSKFVSTNGAVIKYTGNQMMPMYKNEIAIVMSDVPNGRALSRCFLIDEDDKYSLNQRIGGIVSLSGIYHNYLIKVLDRNKHYLSFNDGKKQTNLKKSQIMSCPVPLPPLAEQRAIVEKVETLMQKVSAMEEEINKSEQYVQMLMQAVLKEAFEGKKEKYANA